MTGNTFYFEWEVALITWLQTHLGSFGTLFAKVFNFFGGETFTLMVAVLIYVSINKELGKKICTRLALGVCSFGMIKNIFLRRRPYFDHGDIQCLSPVDSSGDLMDIAVQGYSFPSGHSLCSMTMFGSLIREVKRRWFQILMAVLILLVGISRFVAGVHYPTDVLGGWALAIIIMAFCIFVEKKIGRESLRYGLYILIAAIGLFYCRSNDYFTGLGMLIGMSLGFLFESRFVRFENTRRPLAMILRFVLGVMLFVVLLYVPKMVLPEALLSGSTWPAFLVRMLRYGIASFILSGIYPMCFKLGNRFNLFSQKA